MLKSSSRPARYAFELKNQLAVKLANNEVKSSPGFCVLEPVSDFRRCSNNCFANEDFCKCEEFLPVRIKVGILSNENCYQEHARSWAQKVKEIFSRQKDACPGVYLDKVINIVTNTFEPEVAHHRADEEEASTTKILRLVKSTSTKKKIIDEVIALLGFSLQPFDESRLQSLVNKSGKYNGKHESPHDTPKDVCEICWASLSDQMQGNLNKNLTVFSLQ